MNYLSSEHIFCKPDMKDASKQFCWFLRSFTCPIPRNTAIDVLSEVTAKQTLFLSLEPFSHYFTVFATCQYLTTE